jgi:phosphoribosylformylglycinamidine (FGAM) synthase PurS component
MNYVGCGGKNLGRMCKISA